MSLVCVKAHCVQYSDKQNLMNHRATGIGCRNTLILFTHCCPLGQRRPSLLLPASDELCWHLPRLRRVHRLTPDRIFRSCVWLFGRERSQTKSGYWFAPATAPLEVFREVFGPGNLEDVATEVHSVSARPLWARRMLSSTLPRKTCSTGETVPTPSASSI